MALCTELHMVLTVPNSHPGCMHTGSPHWNDGASHMLSEKTQRWAAEMAQAAKQGSELSPQNSQEKATHDGSCEGAKDRQVDAWGLLASQPSLNSKPGGLHMRNDTRGQSLAYMYKHEQTNT